MTITLRAAAPRDFPFCEAIYFTEMDQIMTDLGMDKVRQRDTFKAGWSEREVEVIQFDGRDVGWMPAPRPVTSACCGPTASAWPTTPRSPTMANG